MKRKAFIGVVAVQRWGEPRFTQDADITLITGLDDPGGAAKRVAVWRDRASRMSTMKVVILAGGLGTQLSDPSGRLRSPVDGQSGARV